MFKDFEKLNGSGKSLKPFLRCHSQVFPRYTRIREPAKLCSAVTRITTVFAFGKRRNMQLHFVNAESAEKANLGLEISCQAVSDSREFGVLCQSQTLLGGADSATYPSQFRHSTGSTR